MSTALDWLRQQRRPPLAPPGHPHAEGNEWEAMVQTLRRLRERGPRRVALPSGKASDRRLPGDEVAPGLWRHTALRAGLLAPPVLDLSGVPSRGRTQRCAPANPFDPSAVDATRLRFFDTETTGLAGGSGTRAFMVGVARFTDAGLAITQFTTATMAAEPALLDALRHAVAGDSILVSYNGRSYDRPLLSTRFTLARMADPLRDLPHVDLLHTTRRRWRDTLPDCRLATVERHRLGIVRDDDLPGSEAPAAWRDYLRGGSATLLRRVGEHNAQDLASLATLLLAHLQVGIVPQ